MLGAGSFVPTSVTRLTIGPPRRAQEHIQQSQFQPLVGVDPLQTTWLERGAVRSRVALLLRSSETQPLFNDLSSIDGSCPQASDQSPPGACSRGCCCCWLARDLAKAPCLRWENSPGQLAGSSDAYLIRVFCDKSCSRGCCCSPALPCLMGIPLPDNQPAECSAYPSEMFAGNSLLKGAPSGS